MQLLKIDSDGVVADRQYTQNNIGWKKPDDGFVGLNCEGAVIAAISAAGCGGVTRNSDGNFLTAFAANLGICSVVHAELWDIDK
ncbi:ribonuclease H [Trifolium medium]|uniref:Ribonuclease H n=1 Tax=Trifolium medium TaxID=97028 RepID=A0A392MYS1_9FABA|nr:ribonuclease H [Trifolium medium]